MARFIRPLNTKELVEIFVRDVLGISSWSKEFDKAVSNIFRLELQVERVETMSTLTSAGNRHRNYRKEEDRDYLQGQILRELFTQQRLESDEKITLGKGGALPVSGVKYGRTAYYVIGLPASGKSGITNEISEKYGAAVLDADYAKRKLPEYSDEFGPAITHEESSLIVFGGKGSSDSLLSKCIEQGMNMVIPKIGSEFHKAVDFVAGLRDNNYAVHLILVRLDRVEATRRAYTRYLKTDRYVTLPLIFDGYGNEPTIVYYDLKRCYPTLFESFTMLSTAVKFGQPPEVLECTANSPFKKQ